MTNEWARVQMLYAALCELKDPINQFFDEVYVMDEDLEQRAANLGLMQAIADLPKGLVDLTKLQGF